MVLAKWPVMAAVVVLALCGAAYAGDAGLENGFASPPMSARPWVYWWFEGGYASKEGMARDIAEMREKGIGGVLHMQTLNASGMPLPFEPKMLSDEWAGWFGEAARLTKQAGMTMGASIVDGWGHGGPWVGPEDGAKMLVYSEVQVDGPGRIAKPLPQPMTRLGVYRDVAVVAFRERTRRALTPAAVSASSSVRGYCAEENWPAAHAADCDPDTCWRAGSEPSEGKPQWLACSYLEPIAATGAMVVGAMDGGPGECEIQASDDGKTFRSVARFSMLKGKAKRVKFPETRSQHFRLLITSSHVPDVRVAEFVILRAGDEPVLRHGVKWWDLKSGNRGYWRWPERPYEALEEDYQPDGAADLRRDQVIDLSDHLKADGTLDWKAPAGRWTIMRFGWTPIAQPARMSSNGGYEVDVLSARGADLMADSAQARMLEVTEKAAPGALTVFHTDSWEIGADVGGQQPTWTDDFREQFAKLRGYDLVPYLPAMARRLVDSRDTTSRFLRDYRDTIADLLAAYYARQQERAHQRNCLVNPESGYGTYPFPHMDGLRVFGRADLPMAESWHANDVMSSTDRFCDAMRTAASGARIYGRQLVQAETLTFLPLGGPPTPPEQYRRTLNHTFAEGVNQAVIHKYVHQPFEYKPGLEDYGLFSRHYTWWPMADAFFSYISRCQYLLQQGLLVADAAYFVGEGASRFVPGKEFLKPELPSGCDYDGVNAEVLLTRMSVQDGRLVLPDGLSYRYLVLSQPQCTTMSPAVLAKIKQLVVAGATVIGNRPHQAPGLADRATADARVMRLASELWGDSPVAQGMRKVGKGRVIWGRTVGDVLSADGVRPDVELDCDTASPADLSRASWIWHAADGDDPQPCSRLFLTDIIIPNGRKVRDAKVTMTADNAFTLSVDGSEVCSGDDYKAVTTADLAAHLHSGRNKLIVRATNGGSAPNPAGIVGSIEITLDNGVRIVRRTDAGSWVSSVGDEKWDTPRTVGPFGCAPWGRVAESDAPRLEWIHRRTNDADVYFLANPTGLELRGDVALRCTGRQPELFDPLTGEARPLPQFSEKNGCTIIPMRFAPSQAFFVVLREKLAKPSGGRNFPEMKHIADVTGPWQVALDPTWLKPALSNAAVTFDKLTDWTQRPEEAIKHYSGIATYSTAFTLSEIGSRLYVDLGVVKEVARVRVNGKDCGVLWCSPWRVDITSAAKVGENRLEIEVANLWTNRVIADAALPEDQRLTEGTYQLPAEAGLVSSGLLGPVVIKAE